MDRTKRAGRVLRGIGYKPLPSQEEFHASHARFKGFSGPIGSGKSQALCHEAIKLTYLNPGRTGLIGAPTYPMLRDATQRNMLETLESNDLPYEFNKAENVITLPDTGSKILFRAVDEFERLRGTNLAWFGIDELTYAPEEAWLRLEGRLRDPEAKRLCGFAVWTPKGFDWVHRKFYSECPKGYELVRARPFENRHILDRVPDFYERLKHSYDDLFYRQEVLGEYLSTRAGLVYHSFRRELHTGECEINPLLPVLWALDFNVEPMSSLVAQMDNGVVKVIDEIVISRGTTLQACQEFAERMPVQYQRVIVYGDASGARMQTAGTSDYQIVREFFRSAGVGQVEYKVPYANPAVRDRVALVNAKLLAADGSVQVRVNARCKELIKDLEQVAFKPETYIIDKDSDPQRTHLSDALGYLIWQECRQRPTNGEQARRLL